jgi:LysR family nitrogen assimilation transcriptional regulator
MPAGNELDLGKLRQFIELARVGHYGRAAARLGIEQPQLSRTMRRFEQELDAELLQRHSRGVTVTDFGRNLAEVGEGILAASDAVHKLRKDPSVQDEDEVTVGLPLRLGPALTGAVFEGIRRRWPERRVRFIEASTALLEGHTMAGRVQASLLYDPPASDGLISAPLLEEDLAFVFAPVWNLSLPVRPLRLREVMEFPLVLPTVTHGDRRLVLKAEARYGLRLHPLLEIDSPMTLRALVNAGVGATITGGPSLQEDLAQGFLASHPIADPVLRTRLCAAAARHPTPWGATAELVQILNECVTSLVRGGQWPSAALVQT